MSRGNSLVAGVVLIGMLTTLAVALQSANPQVESDAQVAASLAQVKKPAPPPPKVDSKNSKTPKMEKCDPFSYNDIIETGPGVYEVKATPFDEAKKKECEKNGNKDKECMGKVRWCLAPAMQHDKGASNRNAKTGQPENKCFDTDEECDPKKGLDPELQKKAKEKVAGGVMKHELLRAIETGQTDQANKIRAAIQADASTNEWARKFLSGDIADKAAEIEDQQTKKELAEQSRDRELAYLQRCYEKTNYGPCETEQLYLQEAEERLAEEERRLKELQDQQERLQAAQKSLEPGTPPEKECVGEGCIRGPDGKMVRDDRFQPPKEKTEAEKLEEQYKARQKELEEQWRRKMAEIRNPNSTFEDPSKEKKQPEQGKGGGGGQPQQQPPQQQQQPQQSQNQQCGWMQWLMSNCPQLECKIQASTPNPQPGQPVTLQWQTTGGNAQYATITNLGSVPPNGQAQVNPQVTTMYSMQVQGQMQGGQGGFFSQGQSQSQSAQCQTTVTIGSGAQPGAPTLTFSAVPSSIAQGDTAKLRWNAQNVTTCNASDGWSGAKSQSGEESVSPLKTTAYGLSCQGNTGSVSRQVTITVGGTTSSTSPAAEISCEPKIADVGMKVAIAYSCKNSVKGMGVGFSTNDQTSGSAEATIEKPPAGTDTVSYGLICTGSDGSEAKASPLCKVQINKPSLILVANPKKIDTTDNKKDVTTLGWMTKGMKSCVISSPDDDAFTEKHKNKKNTSGSLKTDELNEDTEFVLTCVTLADQEKETSVTVEVI